MTIPLTSKGNSVPPSAVGQTQACTGRGIPSPQFLSWVKAVKSMRLEISVCQLCPAMKMIHRVWRSGPQDREQQGSRASLFGSCPPPTPSASAADDGWRFTLRLSCTASVSPSAVRSRLGMLIELLLRSIMSYISYCRRNPKFDLRHHSATAGRDRHRAPSPSLKRLAGGIITRCGSSSNGPIGGRRANRQRKQSWFV